MMLLTIIIGVIVGHTVVWGVVRQMRRDGYRFHRYQLAVFCVGELFLAIVLLKAQWFFFLWVALNAAFLAIANRLSPPKRPF